jgi:hypothetical protein
MKTRRNSFGRSLLKGAALFIIQLQTACVANLAMPGNGSQDWNAPNSSPRAANDSPSSWTCNTNITEEAEDLRQVEEVVQTIESWNAVDGDLKKVVVGTTLAGAVIGGIVAHESAKNDQADDDEEVVQGVVTGALIGAEAGFVITMMIYFSSLQGGLTGWF